MRVGLAGYSLKVGRRGATHDVPKKRHVRLVVGLLESVGSHATEGVADAAQATVRLRFLQYWVEEAGSVRSRNMRGMCPLLHL
jgi:hypothetical protein